MAELDVLVIGSGGREYELARQMTLSSSVRKVYVTPGNGGTASLDKTENVGIGPTAIEEIVAFVKEKLIGFTIIGPDAAVAAGVGNALKREGCLVFGPTREAGKLESSKAFAADFMNRHSIPQPKSQVVRSLDEALAAIQEMEPDTYVLKADGLAAGKGVILPQSTDEAKEVLREMFSGEGFDGAGKEGVVIQERLHGPELSGFAVTDGKDFVLLPLSQDHKRLQDNDQGPNTGGMGAYAPVPSSIVNEKQLEKIRTIAEQTISSIAADGTPYQGVLYIGLMLAEERDGDPVVIEYNARFGDPEAEILLPLLSESGVDVADMLMQVAGGNLSQVTMPETLSKSVLTVALASAGYPMEPRKGDAIEGLEKQYPGVVVQHAGTKHDGDVWHTAGGRVLYVTGFGNTIDEAAANAYAAIGPEGIHFEGMQFRSDIGHQARK
jgi:phosphoribosylamine--glycine ligase